jgi:hypothetical protein
VISAVLVAGPAGAVVPDDNGKIAFGHNGRLWAIDGDGADAVPLISEQSAASYDWPAWAPDGTRLAVGRFDLGRTDIWTVSADGSGVNVTGLHGTDNLEPSWSPDGSRVAFVSRSSPSARADIWRMAPDGSQLVNLANSPTIEESGPDWSPDGTKIAFGASMTSGTSVLRPDVWVMNADGSSPINLTNSPGTVDRTPAWSPDGSRIAFSRDSSIWVMNSDGANPIRLSPVGQVEGDPAWSPDGRQIAFIEFGIGGGEADSNALAVMNADGSNRRRLFTSAPGEATGEFHNSSPSWQPLPGVHRVGLVDPDQGKWYLREQGTVRSFYYGNPGDVPFLGDWDCDGEDTPGLYRQLDGFVYLRNSNTQGIADVRFFFGNPDDIPLAGDFDGDGCDTVSVYRPSEGRVYIHNRLGSQGQSLGPAQLSYYFGNPGDKPYTGDFNGNGVDTVGLHRESTGLVYFRNSHTQGFADASFFFGNPGDRFVAGDWTQDGIDTPGLFRPADTKFFFRNTNTQGNADAALVWGESDWLPVAGNFSLTGLSPAAVDVSVFFSSPGFVDCAAVVAATRRVEPPAVLAGAMKELLAGPRSAEMAAGLSSWFSSATAGMMNWATISGGVARVDFMDFSTIIFGASSSCGSAALLAGLDGTATQFPTVNRAVYSFNGNVAAFYNWLQLSPPPGF